MVQIQAPHTAPPGLAPVPVRMSNFKKWAALSPASFPRGRWMVFLSLLSILEFLKNTGFLRIFLRVRPGRLGLRSELLHLASVLDRLAAASWATFYPGSNMLPRSLTHHRLLNTY